MSKTEARSWRIQTLNTLPPSRKASCMACDTKRHNVLLFGGGGCDDTWMWNGVQWQQLSPEASPPARTNACMVYDEARDRVLLFGGVSDGGYLLNDTWTWDGTQWCRQWTPDELEARCGACMTYDNTRKEVVLFGGQTYGGRVGTLLNDTWTWNGTCWQAQTPVCVPSVRQGASLTHHAATEHVVLFGGTSGYATYNDTWLWDGSNWQERAPLIQPPARAWANLVYHHASQQSVLVGGGGHDAYTGLPAALGDTWLWDGNNWQEMFAQNSPAGGYHSAAYDALRQNIVVYAAIAMKPDLGTKLNGDQVNPDAAMPPLETQFWMLA